MSVTPVTRERLSTVCQCFCSCLKLDFPTIAAATGRGEKHHGIKSGSRFSDCLTSDTEMKRKPRLAFERPGDDRLD